MSEAYNFGVEPISCHTFNKDRTQLALSLNNNEAQIHQFSGGKWNQIDTLIGHGQRITGIDWSHKNDHIATSSADRNAHVWKKDASGKWKPTLVVLGLPRAATCIKWSPDGVKFAVGSGNKNISICYFDSVNNWWTSKKIKKPIRSTVTCLDWHPNNQLIACGSTDMKTRVFSACLKEVNESPNPSSWGSKLTFANMMAEFTVDGGGWVHGVCFSASGDKLAWVSHDSSICVADSTKGNVVVSIKTDYLPFMDIIWINDSTLVAGGHECIPIIFTYGGKDISFKKKLDADSKQDNVKKSAAMAHFMNQDKKGTSGTDATTMLSSLHQNTIYHLSIHTGGKDNCSKFVSSAADGQLVIWDAR